jgi:NAD(P)-dependent dehydrogenase (short-subunit alcohol dehydrogenase family)
MRLAGKVAIITGAGSGMGKAMAELFVREGAKVVLADISGDQDAVAAGLGDAAVAVQCDVAQEDQVIAMIATAEDRFGKLDILCNNAGFGGGIAPLADQSAEHWDRVHSVNIRGVFLGMKYGIQSMLKTGGGAIVNTGSASAVVGWKGHGVYGAAKAGVHQMTKAAALDYAKQGIRVNAIAPGTMWTGLVPQSKDSPEPPEGIFRVPGIPMDRWGSAMDIAMAALFLASDEANYITGVILPVDGGYSIGFSSMGAEHTGAPGS